MNFIRFLLRIGKSEQELYEESLQDAEKLLEQWERNQPIAKSAQRRIPQIIKGLQLDGVQADADLIQRLAMIAADGYIRSHWFEQLHGQLDEDVVREVFKTEYGEAYQEGIFSYPPENRFYEE